VQNFAKYKIKSCIQIVTSVKFVFCPTYCKQDAKRTVEKHLEMRLVDNTGKSLKVGGRK